MELVVDPARHSKVGGDGVGADKDEVVAAQKGSPAVEKAQAGSRTHERHHNVHQIGPIKKKADFGGGRVGVGLFECVDALTNVLDGLWDAPIASSSAQSGVKISQDGSTTADAAQDEHLKVVGGEREAQSLV